MLLLIVYVFKFVRLGLIYCISLVFNKFIFLKYVGFYKCIFKCNIGKEINK